MTNDDETNSV